MSSSTDILAQKLTATGLMTSGRKRIKTLWLVVTGAGSIVIREGSASGATKIDMDVSVAGNYPIFLGGNGVVFNDTPHVTLAGISSVTIFYG